jgi:ribonucleotide reductase beta subunit family protein with ferritin-like domain
MRKEVKEYLERKFASGRVHLSDNSKSTHLFGIWGLSLRESNGMRERKLTRKRIIQFCNATGQKEGEWTSLLVASEVLGIPKSTLSTYIRFKRVVNGKYWEYTN